MLSHILQVLFNMSDIAVVGHFSGAEALGAVGSTTTLVTLFTDFLIGVGNGVNVFVARYFGAKSKKDIEETVHTSFLICLLSGAAVAVVGVAFSRLFMSVLDTDINNRHHLYAGVYYNSFDNDSNVVKNGSAYDPMNNLNVYYTRDGSGRFVENKATRADRADVKDIKRTVVEFGAKGELSKDGKFGYDAAGVYSKVQYSSLDPNTYQDPDPAKVRYNSHDEDGWMAHAAVKYDNKKDWTAKVSYTYADDKSAASINRRDDNVWCGEEETPFQDILWYQCEGTNTYLNMQRIYNMQDVKLQVGYTPVNASKHHFRLAFDWVLEADDRYNTYKDARNTMNYDKLDFKMLTFEYTYDLSENTKLRMGYAKTFEDSVIKRGLRTSAGIVNASPVKAKDQHIFYSELYSKF